MSTGCPVSAVKSLETACFRLPNGVDVILSFLVSRSGVIMHEPIDGYTDYPFAQLGDRPFCEAPRRQIRVLGYDGNKYSVIEVINTGPPLETEIKAGYVTDEQGQGLHDLISQHNGGEPWGRQNDDSPWLKAIIARQNEPDFIQPIAKWGE